MEKISNMTIGIAMLMTWDRYDTKLYSKYVETKIKKEIDLLCAKTCTNKNKPLTLETK